ncbi:hypothetical protein K474DRAFT_1713615 [Panus rudis PR-1116 ss-1]|nr:hypothetical protein K474DRAFT_1713615 [Panus rudis PR-1116 ss-1]
MPASHTNPELKRLVAKCQELANTSKVVETGGFIYRECPWPNCGTRMRQVSNLYDHIKTQDRCCPYEVRDETKRMQCPFASANAGSLTRHMVQVHGYIPPNSRRRRSNRTRGVSSDPKDKEDRSVRHGVHPYVAPGTDHRTRAAGRVAQNPIDHSAPQHDDPPAGPPQSASAARRVPPDPANPDVQQPDDDPAGPAQSARPAAQGGVRERPLPPPPPRQHYPVPQVIWPSAVPEAKSSYVVGIPIGVFVPLRVVAYRKCQ